MRITLLSWLVALTAGSLSAVTATAASSIYETNDVLTSSQALGRFQWLEKCYDGLLLEVAEKMFDPTNPIPNHQKISQLKSVFLYQNGNLRSDAKYLSFGDENGENPKGWYAGTSASESCRQIPSDYRVSGLMVSLDLPSYCAISSRDKDYEFIKSVKLADVENISTESFYSNYMGQAIRIYGDTSYTLELTPGFVGDESYPESWHVFVDWNGDGDFNDAQETNLVGASETTISYKLTPPTGSKVSGLTKMRITMDYFGGQANACKDVRSGEVEDYLLYIK